MKNKKILQTGTFSFRKIGKKHNAYTVSYVNGKYIGRAKWRGSNQKAEEIILQRASQRNKDISRKPVISSRGLELIREELIEAHKNLQSVPDNSYRVATVTTRNQQKFFIKFDSKESLERQLETIRKNYNSNIFHIDYSAPIPFATYENPSYKELSQFSP